MNHASSTVTAASAGRAGGGSSGSGASGWFAAKPASQSRPSRTVTGQGAALSTAAQTRMAVGMARNIPCPAPFSAGPTSPGAPVHSSLPPSSTAAREARGKASSSRCSVRMTVVPSSRLIRPRTARKSEAAMGSSWLVGSSRISTEGCMAMTEARLSNCFCPPDRSETFL